MRSSTVILGLCVSTAVFVAVPESQAHRLEPLSTEFAIPFKPKAGGFEVTYEYERERPGASEQAIPEAEIELGLFPRLQMNAGYSLLRVDEGRGERPRWTGGRVEVGARYLLFGGEGRSYVVSLQGGVEAPTGSSMLLGDAAELAAALHFDKNLGRRLRAHSNLGWETTVGGSERPERVFFYNNAVVWMPTLRWNPVLEVLGETETRTGETKLAIQPELIYWVGPHLELKVGVPIGMTSSSPDIGFRFQVVILWGVE